MEKQSSHLDKKVQNINLAYEGITKILIIGCKKIKKDLRKSRRVRLCREAQLAREHLNETLDSIPNFSNIQHIKVLVSAVKNVIYQLKKTKGKFYSKEHMHIREFAEDLLEKVKTEYLKITKTHNSGDQPMEK